MEGSQTLEAIFTSSANSDRLPPPPLSRISAALSHKHTFSTLHPSQTTLLFFQVPKQYVIFSKLDISVSLA